MKINDNGIVRDMTPEEESAFLEVQIQLQPTEQDKLEAQMLYTAIMTNTLTNGEYPISEKIKRFYDLGLYTSEEYKTITGES